MTTAVQRVAARRPAEGPLSRFVPAPVRALLDEIDERTARIPTRLNEYGYDSFGFDPVSTRYTNLVMAWMYRSYLRVEARGVERVPQGRVLLIANHAGNTMAWDGAMLAMAMFLEAEPPRLVRGMAEFFLPTVPFLNTVLHRSGSVVFRKGTVDRKYSAIPRTSRGGSASRNIAIESMAPSHAIVLPAWLAIRSTRPCGTRSTPRASTRR